MYHLSCLFLMFQKKVTNKSVSCLCKKNNKNVTFSCYFHIICISLHSEIVKIERLNTIIMDCKVLRQTERFSLLSVIFMFLVALGAFAQPGQLFDADKQLSSSFTSQVYIDRDGFLWVATRNGLNKYDGYQFQIIKKEQNGKNGMASNYVNAMTQDDRGLFYLGMYGAFQTYDGREFRDVEVKDLTGKTVPCYMTCFLNKKDGTILAGTSGHGLLKVIDSGHAVQLNGALKDVHTVYFLAEDRQGHVWLVTDIGLLEYDGKKALRHLTDEKLKGKILRVCIDRDNNIFVGTTVDGVYVRSANSKEFRHLDVTGHKHVSSLYSLRDGQLVIGYDGQGVSLYQNRTGQLIDNPFFSHEIDLSKSKVYSIAEDAKGNIWMGLLQKGVFMQPRKTLTFHYLGYKLGNRNVIGQACVVSTIIDSKGRCWVGTDKDGLYCLDSNQNLLKHFIGDGFPSTVLSMVEDAAGRIWVGSYDEGFGYVDANGGSYHKFPQYQNSSGFSMATTAGGDLWISTMGQGLLRIDTQTNSIKKAYTMQSQAPDNPKVNSIANDYISKMSVSPDGKRIYTATTMGVCCLDIEKNSWTSTFGKNCLNYGVPSRIVKEYGGKLWVGTNDGLCCYDLVKHQSHSITTEEGLADNGISSIEQDLKGRLWIGTDHGLCCYDPKTGLTQSFFVDNGLQSNEFSDGASIAIDRGNRVVMVFGGVGGITWFHPERIAPDEWKAQVRLVDFLVEGTSINSPRSELDYQVCDTTVLAANRFVVKHDDNTFSVRISTLTYDNPEHIIYYYSINGEKYTRLQPGTNEITISHLPPGTYHFKVRAERNNQKTAEREFTVVVKAPWWRTPWAYAAYFLLLAAAVWYFITDRRHKEQTRLRLQEHMHAEEMGEAKLRFFMNISHDIRTPMTLIITPLLSLMKQDKDPHRQGVYKTMKRNSERILHLINQMMDLRKIDKGMMRMRMQETDLVEFVGEIYSLFEQQAKSRSISLNYVHDTQNLPVWIDRQNFDKVVVNILSNAFKFTPTGGEICINVTHDDHQATIAISDDGEQIPEDKQEKIFERFYQNPSSSNDRNVGTGIGLDLTRSLVELHYGSIKVHNLDKGCEFVVNIPLGNAHLKPEEMVTDLPESEPVVTELEESLPETSETEMTIPAGSQTTIVVVEDDDEIRNYLEKELSSDYDVKTATNGREALSVIYHCKPNLIISDVMMPEMDGNALCAQIKANSATSHIPVILLTAKNREEDKLEGLETGADAYIVKPFNMEILRRTIVNMLRSQKLMQQKYQQTEPLEQKVEQVKMKSPDEKLLERVMNVINKNITNSDLNVDMIAEEVGISRVHLHRKMKELTGSTPHDFVRNIRLKQAANLLTNQGMNITEVAYACGFSNAGTFSKIFKNVYGMSPREFMEGH